MTKPVSISGLVGHMLLMLESDATEQEIEDFLEKNYPTQKQLILEQVVTIWASLKTAEANLKE